MRCKDCTYRLPAKGCSVRSGKWKDGESCSSFREKEVVTPDKEKELYL